MSKSLSSNIRTIIVIAAACLGVSSTTTQADELLCPNCGCGQGARVVEVSRTICKMVTKQEPIKKTVYEKKEVPFCEHCVGPLGHHPVCPQCKACGKTRTVLVKKSIECGQKTVHECVPEVVIEHVVVPCTKCGFCAPHRHLLHRADTNQNVPLMHVEESNAQSNSPGSSPIVLATEPNLRELSPRVR